MPDGDTSLLEASPCCPNWQTFKTYFFQPHSSFLPECPKVLPTTAKTLEEIEEEMIHGRAPKTCWRVEEMEKALTAEDVERDLNDHVVSDQARNIGHHHLAGSPGMPPAELHRNVSLPMLRMVNQALPVRWSVLSLLLIFYSSHMFCWMCLSCVALGSMMVCCYSAGLAIKRSQVQIRIKVDKGVKYM